MQARVPSEAAERLGYITEDQAAPLAAHHDEISRMLDGLMRFFQRL